VNRRTSVLIAISIVIIASLVVVTYLFIQFEEPRTPSWLKLGAYMRYQQFFAWIGHNQTELMTWNITGLQDNFADLHLISYGVRVNVSDNSVIMSVGEANWTLNAFDRVIVNATDSSYVGYKCPFWIESTVGIGSTGDSLYGETTIVRNETINVLGQQRDCWVTQQNWTASSMTRWYDKSTGIVLMIHVVLQQSGVTIDVMETGTQTNIGFGS
jgi:hypothetical protein